CWRVFQEFGGPNVGVRQSLAPQAAPAGRFDAEFLKNAPATAIFLAQAARRRSTDALEETRAAICPASNPTFRKSSSPRSTGNRPTNWPTSWTRPAAAMQP